MGWFSEVHLKFPKFATNLAISLRSCQSNRELGNLETCEFYTKLRGEVNKFTAREVCFIQRNCLAISLYVVVMSIRNYWF